jgi:hypothetical protein
VSGVIGGRVKLQGREMVILASYNKGSEKERNLEDIHIGTNYGLFKTVMLRSKSAAEKAKYN